MSSRAMARMGNRIGEWLYRRFDGRMSGTGKDVQVLMMTAPGRRTGRPRSTCVRFLEIPEGLVVWGTGSGSHADPDWFRNLRHASVVDLQIGARHLTAVPRELHGTERDAVWHDVVLAQIPAVARLARKAGRTIPVAVLELNDTPSDR